METRVALEYCQKHPGRIPAQEDESDDVAYITRLDLPTMQVPPMTDALRAVVGKSWPAMNRTQLLEAAETFRGLGPYAWQM